MKTIKFENINKIYDGGVQAVFDFNLEIEEGEFIVFVGPSGCGKSTILRMVSGLEKITSGSLTIDGVEVNNLAPKDRNISFVFQNYALYGNLSVYDNVGMSLKVRHEDPIDIHEKVMPISEMLGIDGYLNRLPGQLSGGQKQRVALGRAITRKPKVFLMDEPLSNLDAKLRNQSRIEIVKLQRELGVTTIYVTHDQVEAMAMATRIVVLKDGVVQQIGTPAEIYQNPKNMFVAGFIGTPPINLIEGEIIGEYFCTKNNKFLLTDEQKEALKGYKEIVLGIRPEAVILVDEKTDDSIILDAENSEFCGDYSNLSLLMGEVGIRAITRKSVDLKKEKYDVVFNMKQAHFFDIKSEEKIMIERK